MSSKDLKTLLDSQLARMNCQMFSCGLSSGTGGGRGRGGMRIELRRARRQRQERDVAWRLEAFGVMPSGLIENENGVGAGSYFRCDLVEMKLHRFGIAKREHEGSTGSEVGTDCTEHVGGLRALIVDRRGT